MNLFQNFKGLFSVFLTIFFVCFYSCKNQPNSPKEKISDKKELVSTTPGDITTKVHLKTDQNCVSTSGPANESGFRMWCWQDIEITEPLNSATNYFSGNHLAINSHCNRGMVTRVNNRLYFNVKPTSPAAEDWCKSDYNYRAEIRENPSDVNHAIGTEQWFGWDYKFGDDYKADALNEWIMWQVHGSFKNPANPLISLWIAKTNMARKITKAGEIVVTNAAQNSNAHKYTPTGIVPIAGQRLAVVVHVIWGDENTGLFEVWIDGERVYSEKERTVYEEKPEGGYAKWGIYKWKWRNQSRVLSSESQGIEELNTSMGPLRILLRKPNDSDYGKNAYDLVAPK